MTTRTTIPRPAREKSSATVTTVTTVTTIARKKKNSTNQTVTGTTFNFKTNKINIPTKKKKNVPIVFTLRN
jgi:exopolysaccharide biosynthesis protein